MSGWGTVHSRRNPRPLSFSRSAALPQHSDVGPGSYDIGGRALSSIEGKPGYAPFLTTAERKLGPKTEADLPGPGYYLLAWCRDRPQTSGPSDVFRSTTRRFKDPQDRNVTPGPGTYLGHDRFGIKERACRGQNKEGDAERIKWVRVPTAPSIPGRDQSYGYEEGNQGELVMQRPHDLGHTGKGDDRPGPLDYRPRVEYTRRSPAIVDFSKGEDRMVALSRGQASCTPGPGYYNASGELGATEESINVHRGVRRKRPRPSPSFQCATRRDVCRRYQEPLPGPGDYKIPGGLGCGREPRRGDLSFLSTSRRFDEHATGARFRAPGPGSYDTALSDFDRWRTLDRLRPRRAHSAPIGFHSTTLRFAGSTRTDEGIGPAAYNIGGMADELQRKRPGNKAIVGAFGSTSRRFPVDSTGQPALPGPGSYDLGVGAVSKRERGGRPETTPCAGFAAKRIPTALSCFASGGGRRSATSISRGGTPATPVQLHA